ncbi:hypothetical protein R5R35_009825 [Gryllus longicercus]|uniref:NudC domain-containing protein 1 n=1 Tax=Gryllus longicercus TaxID=2509291 RepID=A0AAN9VTE9_9ORTH
MVSSKMIELRPNRELLDVNFGSYKLSLDSIPSYQHDFECGVDHVLPSDDQYSFLHLKVFSLHNHLHGDPWSQEDVYFIDKRWRVQRNYVNPRTGRLEGVRQVWEIPASYPRHPGHYNPSLSFPDSETALLADGTGVIHVIVTGFRTEHQDWEVAFSGEVLGCSQPFVIADSRSVNNESSKRLELHCLLMWVEKVPESANETDQSRSSNFQSILAWVVLSEVEGGKWSVLRSCRLAGPGEFHYVALEADCSSLYVASEEVIKFTEDSERSINPPKDIAEVEKGKSNGKKHYMWLQGLEDIEISFNVGVGIDKNEVVVDVKDKSLSVSCQGQTLLQGGLWGFTEPSLSCWSLENNRLQITLSKAESGLMWQSLVPGDCRGEEVVDPALVDEIHEKLAHLCSDKEVTDTTHTPTFNSEQLEECDTGQTNSVLMRLDPISHEVSHQASLGGHQALFLTCMNGSESPALCLRHDVDGCVWQPQPQNLDTSEWPIVHVGTFHAFGYVQASKQQRKFTVCAPDLSYVAICDANRHVYVYRQPTNEQGALRNRRTGQKVSHTAQQQLVALSDNAEIMGAHASNHTLFVLTTNYILALNVNP